MEVKQQLLDYASRGLSRSEIAKALGRSRSWVNKWMAQYGIKTHAKPGAKPGKKGKIKNNSCEVCGGTIKRNASKYCSSSCCAKAKWEKTKRKIQKTGKIDNSKQGRKYFIEAQGCVCSICGCEEWNRLPIPLVLDHINGNADDWRLQNLRMVCHNCDAQLPTYKNKNRGNGRHTRRQRYSEGKSY